MKSDPTDRQAKKRATRARILEVARIHFERDGFAGASVRAIAGEAWVAVGTVVLHFEDKVSLLYAAWHSDLEAAILKSLSAPLRGGILNRLSPALPALLTTTRLDPLSREPCCGSLYSPKIHGESILQNNLCGCRRTSSRW